MHLGQRRLLQLLPIDYEFHFTQTAVTRGWFQGDGMVAAQSPKEKLEEIQKVRGGSIWNSMSGGERERLIRSMGIDALKEDGFYSVSGQTYIHAYDPATNTFAMVRSYNPLAGVDSVEDVDRAAIKEYLLSLQGQMNSTTDNINTIKIKKQDENGNLVTSEVNCSGDCNKKIVLVIPEDPQLQTVFDEIIAEMGTDVDFDIQPGYGSVFEEPAAGGGTAEGEE